MNYTLKAYASYFVSYLLSSLDELSTIDQIILFGSVARGEADKHSDVDIFIEMKKKETLKKRINKIVEEFYGSREAFLFKNKGIDNKIHVLMGRLGEWKELGGSIQSTGVVLYGPYISSQPGSTRKQVIISWDKIGKNRGAFLNKVYGFSVKGKKYPGLIEKLGGRKTGKSSIMIPLEYRKELFDLITKYKVDARMIEVYATQKF